MHVELVNIKWQKFPEVEKELNLMIKEIVETSEEETSIYEGDLDVAKKPIPVDVVTDNPVVTSGEVQVVPTTFVTNSDAEIGTTTVTLKVERIEENPDGVDGATGTQYPIWPCGRC